MLALESFAAFLCLLNKCLLAVADLDNQKKDPIPKPNQKEEPNRFWQWLRPIIMWFGFLWRPIDWMIIKLYPLKAGTMHFVTPTGVRKMSWIVYMIGASIFSLLLFEKGRLVYAGAEAVGVIFALISLIRCYSLAKSRIIDGGLLALLLVTTFAMALESGKTPIIGYEIGVVVCFAVGTMFFTAPDPPAPLHGFGLFLLLHVFGSVVMLHSELYAGLLAQVLSGGFAILGGRISWWAGNRQ